MSGVLSYLKDKFQKTPIPKAATPGGDLSKQQINVILQQQVMRTPYNVLSPLIPQNIWLNPDPVVQLEGQKGISIYSAMQMDPFISAACNTRDKAVTRCTPILRPASSDPEDQKRRDHVRDCFSQVAVKSHTQDYRLPGFKKIIRLIQDGKWKGYTGAELVWDLKGGRIAEVIHHVPQAFQFGGEGSIYDVKDWWTGYILWYRPSVADDWVKAPPKKFAMFIYDAEYSNPYGKSQLRPAYWPWWASFLHGTPDWMTFMNKWAAPSVAGHYDIGVINGAVGTQFIEAAASFQNGFAGYFPRNPSNGEKSVEVMSVDRAGSSGAFKDYMDYFNRCKTLGILGNILGTQEAQFGTRAHAQVHENTQDDWIDSDIEYTCEQVQILIQLQVDTMFGRPEWVSRAVNGDQPIAQSDLLEIQSLYPQLELQPEENQDYLALSQVFTALAPMGPIPWSYIKQQFGIPDVVKDPKTGKDEALATAPAAPAAGPDAGGKMAPPPGSAGAQKLKAQAQKLAENFAETGTPMPRSMRRLLRFADAYASWTPKASVALGDVEGHEFHGNQYTGGRGGNGKDTTDMEDHSRTSSGISPVASNTVTRDDFINAAVGNMKGTSRTASGVSDTSSSSDKPKLNTEGADLAKKTEQNFRDAAGFAHDNKDRSFNSPEEVKKFSEDLAWKVSNGLLPEGQGIYRTWDTEHNMKMSDVPAALAEFHKDFAAKWNDPSTDPKAFAAWTEKRFDTDIHALADGSGRTTKLFSGMILARAGIHLPKYPDKKTYYKESTKSLADWTKFYKSLFTQNHAEFALGDLPGHQFHGNQYEKVPAEQRDAYKNALDKGMRINHTTDLLYGMEDSDDYWVFANGDMMSKGSYDHSRMADELFPKADRTDANQSDSPTSLAYKAGLLQYERQQDMLRFHGEMNEVNCKHIDQIMTTMGGMAGEDVYLEQPWEIGKTINTPMSRADWREHGGTYNFLKFFQANSDSRRSALDAAIAKVTDPEEEAWKKEMGLGDVEGHDFHGNQYTGGTGSGSGDVFVSPNTEENTLSFDEALKRTTSPEQRALESYAFKVADETGSEIGVQSVVGAWADGAENTLMISSKGDPAKRKYLAAKVALEGRQKQALVIDYDRNGKDLLVETHVDPADLHAVRDSLNEAGIFHTIVPGGGVKIFDEGGSLLDKLQTIGEKHGIEFTAKRVTGHFIGDLSKDSRRDKAGDEYRKIISAFENKVRGLGGRSGSYSDWDLSEEEAVELYQWSLSEGGGNPYHVPAGTPEGGQFTTSNDVLNAIGKRESTMENLPPKTQEKVREALAKLGTPEEIEKRYKDLLIAAAADGNLDKGKQWYQIAHDDAVQIAGEKGLKPEQTVAVLAAISPGLEWSTETGITRGMIDLEQHGVINLPEEQLAAVNAQLDKFGLDPVENGTKFSDIEDPMRAVVPMRSQFQENGRGGWPTPYGYPPFEMGLACVRSDDPSDVLTGTKRRSFYNNIGDPENSRDVTIDVQMLQAAADSVLIDDGKFINTPSITRTITRSDGSKREYKNTLGVTPAVADIVRRVADNYGVKPHAAQAAIWLEWKYKWGPARKSQATKSSRKK